jgi:hypothetical protein
MSAFLLGGLILSLALLLAVSGLVFAQHRIPSELRQSHNVPISIIYGAISVTLGVIIGFSAYLVLNKYTTSQTTVVNEASDVRALYYLAGQFPQAQRDQIQDLATSYAKAVVDEEWPLMEQGHRLAHELLSSTSRLPVASTVLSQVRVLSRHSIVRRYR